MARETAFDFCVIGGGIVGLSTALALLDRVPDARLLLIEKESQLGLHQTGHNSGVIHAGLYYTPGSQKARMCKQGAEATKNFCRENKIPFEVCGKLVVATSKLELQRMDALEERGRQNGISLERIGPDELGELEPRIRGLGALLVHDTGIVDYRRICDVMAEKIRALGGKILLGTQVTGILEDGQGVTIHSGPNSWRADKLIACAGLQSDRIARFAGLQVRHRIVPFRGEYYVLPSELSGIVKHLIYPVPDPDMPFLGVHITRMIDGRVTVGPNAVLGFAREGYPNYSVSLPDVIDFGLFPGFWKLVGRNWRSGLGEMRRSIFKADYLAECRKYCPSLRLSDLRPYPAGIRAQALDENGVLLHDFLFIDTARSVHVCNAPSPAATSALPIGEMVADHLLMLGDTSGHAHGGIPAE